MKKTLVLSALSLSLLLPRLSLAHCDTLDGPVVKTAAKALETGKVAPVLAWVKAKDEATIKTAFAEAQAVRKLGPAAKELADRSFFETVVRIHRAGEGAPYTGLKPAGSVQDHALEAADRAVETGKGEPVAKLLGEGMKAGLAAKLGQLRARKAPGDDVAKGREWVDAYVAYVHYVVGVHQAVAGKGGGEHEASAEGHAAHHEP